MESCLTSLSCPSQKSQESRVKLPFHYGLQVQCTLSPRKSNVAFTASRSREAFRQSNVKRSISNLFNIPRGSYQSRNRIKEYGYKINSMREVMRVRDVFGIA